MKKISKYENFVIQAYLGLPERKLLCKKFVLEEAYLWEYVTAFSKGERFDIDFTAFTKEENEIINALITKNFNSDDGKDLLTAFLLTKAVCNIMNKYKNNNF